MSPRVPLWGFGHTHFSCDFVHNGTRVVSNARGYAHFGERTGFDLDKVVEFDIAKWHHDREVDKL
jgi:hypothetical protein